MERKRIAGRFAAEDKGGVVKRQPASPRARKTISQPAAVSIQPAEVGQKDSSPQPKGRGKNLIHLLLQSWKRSPATASTPLRPEDPDSTSPDGGGC